MNSSQPQRRGPPESDTELLSAYLDNQLGIAERVSLERRLEAEAGLRVELEELRATVGVLRNLEPVRPPRSFTLDPATVGRPRALFPLAWVMQMGSGLAGLALVLLATVQLISVGAAPASAPMPMMASEAPAAAAMPTAAPAYEAGPAPEAAPAPMADSARQSEAAGEMTPLPTAAATESTAMQPFAPTTTPADGLGGAGPAGGTTGGSTSNSPPPGGAGAPPSVDSTISAVQASESSSPGTAELPAPPAPAGRTRGLPPGLTLALGAALIGLALVWHLYSRRRA